MRNIIRYITGLLFVSSSAFAQQPLPDAYPSGQINFVRRWETKAPIGTADSVRSAALREAKMTSIYIDGLGRPIQEVVRKGSLPFNDTAADIVKGFVYDEQGRQAIDYLHFRALDRGVGESANNGSFKRDPFQEQHQFYNARLEVGSGPNWGYNQTVYEASTLDRATAYLPAGSNWVGSGRGTVSNYWINTVSDSVRIWQVRDSTDKFGAYFTIAIYPGGSLYKNITRDEHGNQIIEYKDEMGKLILRKVQYTADADNGSGSGHLGWACTYMVYDELDRLRAVIQPEGVKLLSANSWDADALGGAITAEQMFRYEYDRKGRSIRKKDPGVAVVYLVYNQRGQMVMSQDGNLRGASTKKWRYFVYDSLGRETSMGLLNDNNNLAYHAVRAYNTLVYPTLSGATYEELTVSHYDDYNNIPAGLSSSLSVTNINSLTINQSYYTAPEYAEPLVAHAKPFGNITWSKRKVLGSSSYISTVRIYDNKGRMIQDKTINFTGASTSTTFQYNFVGKAIRCIVSSSKEAPNGLTYRLFYRYTYDDLGRVIKDEVAFNNYADNYRTLVEYAYDEIGHLKKRMLGRNATTGLPIETQLYDYNVRGWLLGMNRDFAKDSTDKSKYFGFELAYDQAATTVNGISQNFATARYNGTIGGIVWKGMGDNATRKYDYQLDRLNRLTGAAFSQFTGSSFSNTSGLDFSAGFSYDLNGNMKTATQKGWQGTSSGIIDSLLYTYRPYSNQLSSVLDRVNDTSTRMGDFRSSTEYMSALGGTKTTTAVDYEYDSNGNLAYDKNKDVTRISYNYMNLADTVFLKGKGMIIYSYDARGTKLRKKVIDSTVSPVLTTENIYVDNFVYQSSYHDPNEPTDQFENLAYFIHPDGICRHDYIKGISYDYFLKDHLGNVRMVVTDKPFTDVYPDLNLEGGSGSAEVTAQDAFYEKADGSPINVTASRVSRPGAFGDTTTNGHQVMLVRRSTGAFGAGKLLKVMGGKPGDERLHVSVQYYYTTGNANNGGANPLTSFITSFGSALLSSGGVSNALKPFAGNIASSVAADPAMGGLLNSAPNTSGGNSAPKAYLHVLFFDEQFHFDAINSVVIPVAYTPNIPGTIDLRLSNAVNVPRNGYAYIYFSNESNELVYFDNLTITHQRGPITEENHYYPYGLSIAALSTRATGLLSGNYGVNTKEKQTKEFSAGHSLEWYDYGARNFDPQIGRFNSVDPNGAKYAWSSPYAYGFCNPAQVTDPTGKDGVVTGSGSKDDPYVVTANYYYYNMSAEQQAAFKAALNEYNQDGKTRAVETKNGTVYIRFDLKAIEAKDKDDARQKAGDDLAVKDGVQLQYGNTVTVSNKPDAGDSPESLTLGHATNRDITLDEADLKKYAESKPGGDFLQISISNAIHEVGHNLGLPHGIGCIMFDASAVELKDSKGKGTGKYLHFYNAVDNDGISAMIGYFGKRYKDMTNDNLTESQRLNVKDNSRAGMITPVSKDDF
ncbi:DUF6443 domain-containing protein [Chitinophaga arvensicola]|uniref:RHS repeat-associated core domain-containing protein n=1 Tax=Chitinophaga arvensicola TaxID=29529 RepID=A0A1I0PPJ2_9BACT|nr:DUF6443 domain-containing protein [Chitinophaga arvensicola]SEW16296.1 RHS repeat-associated core domain-containing protein [Chitinophaga arvensicola]